MRTDEEMREPLLRQIKAMLRVVLKKGIFFGVFWALGEAVVQYFFGTNAVGLSTALVVFPIVAIVFGTMYGVFNWYYVRQRYRVDGIL